MRPIRPRHYLPPYAMFLLRPLLRYSQSRHAYVLRVVGSRRGPVVRVDRRRASRHFDGVERRQARVA
jgi:hypothetical protein